MPFKIMGLAKAIEEDHIQHITSNYEKQPAVNETGN